MLRDENSAIYTLLGAAFDWAWMEGAAPISPSATPQQAKRDKVIFISWRSRPTRGTLKTAARVLPREPNQNTSFALTLFRRSGVALQRHLVPAGRLEDRLAAIVFIDRNQ